jgi:hypothetical protein
MFGNALKLTVLLLVVVLETHAAPKLCDPRPGRSDTCGAPPPTYVMIASPPPFNALARYGGTYVLSGVTMWVYLKTGPVACTPEQMADPNSYGIACRAAVGEPLYMTQPFNDKPEEP